MTRTEPLKLAGRLRREDTIEHCLAGCFAIALARIEGAHELGRDDRNAYLCSRSLNHPASPFGRDAVPLAFEMLACALQVTSAFGERGITYRAAEKSKSDLYLESLPLFTRDAISIPNYAPLIRELRLLERQTHRGGRDTIDHPRRGSDDMANALCGCAALSSSTGFDTSYAWVG
jgi:hypothetical protein